MGIRSGFAYTEAMAVTEGVVLQQVQQAAKDLADPNFSQLAVGNFVQLQPDVSRYLSAKVGNAGDLLVQLVFHLEFMRQCMEVSYGKAPPVISFTALDAVHGKDSLTLFASKEPALGDYLISNVEDEASRTYVAQVALAFHLSLSSASVP